MLDVINNPNSLKVMGENGRVYFNKHFAKEAVINQLENKIRDCLK